MIRDLAPINSLDFNNPCPFLSQLLPDILLAKSSRVKMIIASLKFLLLLLFTVEGKDQSLCLETFDSGSKGSYSDNVEILPSGEVRSVLMIRFASLLEDLARF